MFFLIVWRTPRSTLFPYTTLFRSRGRPYDRGVPLMAIKGSLKEASLPDVLQLLALGQKTGCLSIADRSKDRKSTRLNSSHGSSSYAVFCLKKKRSRTTPRGTQSET